MKTGERLKDKAALITGGSSGLGLAMAKRFVAEGAHVFITGRRKPQLEAAAKELGPNVTPIQSDVSQLDQLDHAFETIRRTTGRLDVLIANAGGGAFVPLEQITEVHFDKYFGINVKGTVFTVQKALPLMPEGSAIVVTGSMVSVKGFPAFGVYSATKAALRSFVRTWALELKDRKIRVNVISPGTVVTPAYETELGLNGKRLEEFAAQAAATTPLGRTGTPDEIASAVLFLASDESSYVNGIELFVDGGAAQI